MLGVRTMLLPLLLAATATAQYNNVRDPCPAPTQPRQCLALSVCLGKFFAKIAKPKLSSIPLAFFLFFFFAHLTARRGRRRHWQQ